jgi:hypothetical protein
MAYMYGGQMLAGRLMKPRPSAGGGFADRALRSGAWARTGPWCNAVRTVARASIWFGRFGGRGTVLRSHATDCGRPSPPPT